MNKKCDDFIREYANAKHVDFLLKLNFNVITKIQLYHEIRINVTKNYTS